MDSQGLLSVPAVCLSVQALIAAFKSAKLLERRSHQHEMNWIDSADRWTYGSTYTRMIKGNNHGVDNYAVVGIPGTRRTQEQEGKSQSGSITRSSIER